MIALAIRSKTPGLITLTCAIGIIWVFNLAIFFAEQNLAADLYFLNTLADLPLVVWAALRGLRPGPAGKLPFFGVATILTVQTVASLWLVESGAPHPAIDFWMNRLFDAMLAALILLGLLNAEYQRGGGFSRWIDDLWDRNEAELRAAQPALIDAPLTIAANDLGPLWRRVHNLFADIHNDGRPAAEHVLHAQPRPDKATASKGGPASTTISN